MTPPRNLLLSQGDAAALPALADDLIAAGIRPPGVLADAPLARRFADHWQARTGATASAGMAMNLLCAEPGDIVPPAGVAGALRPAGARDLGLVPPWSRRAAIDMGLPGAEVERSEPQAERGVAEGYLFLWTAEARPLSMAKVLPTTPDGDAGRIGLVYTPPELRGRGYASACVAALTQRLLDGPWRYALIFADAANATTNKIYRAVGYRPLAVFQELRFSDGPSA